MLKPKVFVTGTTAETSKAGFTLRVHSPQRGPNTVGLVIEKVREGKEIDGFMRFCEQCSGKLYEEYFHLTDIVSQLPPVMERFYSDEQKRTCKNCGAVMQPPTPAR